MKTNILKKMWTSMLTGWAFVVGWIIMILWVSAFDSFLTTTPWTAWNQSFGSLILSKASGWGFDRTTDSLEALSEKMVSMDAKIDAIPTSTWGWVFTKCQVKFASSATYPSCPSWYSNIDTYSSAYINHWFRSSVNYRRSGLRYQTINDDDWGYSSNTQSRTSTLACTICEKN